MNLIFPIDLNGLRILNTRPLKRKDAMAAAISAAGGISIPLPTLSIEAIENLNLDWDFLDASEQAIFISGFAVDLFFQTLDANQRTWPPRILASAVGHKTAEALKAWGLTAIQVPPIADSEHLMALASFQKITGQRIILITGEGGRGLMESCLKARGAQVKIFEMYRRSLNKIQEDNLLQIWHNDAIDLVLITSQTGLLNLFELIGDHQGHAWLKSKPALVISSRLAKLTEEQGFKTIYLTQQNKDDS